MNYPPMILYLMYFSDGNLISDIGALKHEIEYPDGSRYYGQLKYSKDYQTVLDGSDCQFKRKKKNNYSYYKSY